MEPPLAVSPGVMLMDEPERPSFESSHSANLLEDDHFFAALASAEGPADEEDDPDCAGAVAAIDAAAVEMGRALSARVLAAKSAVAQKAQARQAQMEAEAAANTARLEGLLEEEVAHREAIERRLAKSFEVQSRLADALHETREDATARIQAVASLAEWQRSLAALKREAYVCLLYTSPSPRDS